MAIGLSMQFVELRYSSSTCHEAFTSESIWPADGVDKSANFAAFHRCPINRNISLVFPPICIEFALKCCSTSPLSEYLKIFSIPVTIVPGKNYYSDDVVAQCPHFELINDDLGI